MILLVQYPQPVMFGAGVHLGGMETRIAFQLLSPLWFGEMLVLDLLLQSVWVPVH
jgi:hypothetical protein